MNQSRDQMMTRPKANHIQIVYADSANNADLALDAKAALAAELGIEVSLCGVNADGAPLYSVSKDVVAHRESFWERGHPFSKAASFARDRSGGQECPRL